MYQFKRKQFIPLNLDKAWDFFSKPENLGLITPPKMNFRIILKANVQNMYPGMLISYLISPLFNISFNWITEITHIKEKVYFIDNQVKGPYKIWHHEHHFKKTGNGIEMTDLLFYELPLGILGRFLNKIYIKKLIQNTFNYREQKIKELFG